MMVVATEVVENAQITAKKIANKKNHHAITQNMLSNGKS